MREGLHLASSLLYTLRLHHGDRSVFIGEELHLSPSPLYPVRLHQGDRSMFEERGLYLTLSPLYSVRPHQGDRPMFMGRGQVSVYRGWGRSFFYGGGDTSYTFDHYSTLSDSYTRGQVNVFPISFHVVHRSVTLSTLYCQNTVKIFTPPSECSDMLCKDKNCLHCYTGLGFSRLSLFSLPHWPKLAKFRF